jgi:hypothetical protein
MVVNANEDWAINHNNLFKSNILIFIMKILRGGSLSPDEKMLNYIAKQRRNESKAKDLALMATRIRDNCTRTGNFSDDYLRVKINSSDLKNQNKDPVYQKLMGLRLDLMDGKFGISHDLREYSKDNLLNSLQMIEQRNMKETDYSFFLNNSPESILLVSRWEYEETHSRVSA